MHEKNYYGINTEYKVFRDGWCAIGMFRAITEINVLVQLRSDPLITQLIVLSTVVLWLVRIALDT